jgi:hypothetical protein
MQQSTAVEKAPSKTMNVSSLLKSEPEPTTINKINRSDTARITKKLFD